MAWGGTPVVSWAEGLGTNGGTGGSHDTSGADTIFVSIGTINNPGVSISDSKSNSWTLIKSQDNGFGLLNLLYRSATPASVGSGHTLTVTDTGGKVTIAVTAFAGGATSSIDDQVNGAGSVFQQTIQPGSITPGQDATLIITGCMASDDNREPSTIDSGFTVAASHSSSGGADCNVGIAYLVQGSAAAVNPTWTLANGTAVHQNATIADFKAAAGAGATFYKFRKNMLGSLQSAKHGLGMGHS